MPPPLVSPQNDVWKTSANIPYWRCITTQMRVVLLIGWSNFPSRQDQSEVSPRSEYSDASSGWIFALVLQTSFRGETSGGVAKCRLFSQATRVPTKLYQGHVLDGSCAWVRDKVMWYRLAVALNIAAVWTIVHWMLFIFTVTNWRRKFSSD